MKSSQLINQNTPKYNLKVVQNSLKKRKTTTNKKIYINTLTPNFNYINGKGETITPSCATL